MPKPPAVREYDIGDILAIEIDQKKGQWPFIKAVRFEDGDVAFFIDCNEGGQVIGSGAGLAALRLTPKKAKRLREFLERTEA